MDASMDVRPVVLWLPRARWALVWTARDGARWFPVDGGPGVVRVRVGRA